MNKQEVFTYMNSFKTGKKTSMANQMICDWIFRDQEFRIRFSGSDYSENGTVMLLWEFLNGDHRLVKSMDELKSWMKNLVEGRL